jgi:hypothetical protein
VGRGAEKVSRQCPLVLLVTVNLREGKPLGSEKAKFWDMEGKPLGS